jgi:hypothetical protein
LINETAWHACLGRTDLLDRSVSRRAFYFLFFSASSASRWASTSAISAATMSVSNPQEAAVGIVAVGGDDAARRRSGGERRASIGRRARSKVVLVMMPLGRGSRSRCPRRSSPRRWCGSAVPTAPAQAVKRARLVPIPDEGSSWTVIGERLPLTSDYIGRGQRTFAQERIDGLLRAAS